MDESHVNELNEWECLENDIHDTQEEDYIVIPTPTNLQSPHSLPNLDTYAWICDIEWNGESTRHIREGLSFIVENVPNFHRMDFFYDIIVRVLFQTRHDLGTRNRLLAPVFGKLSDRQGEWMYWPNIICDGCSRYGLPLLRYKCQVCPDFDLCHECYYNPPNANIERHIKYHTRRTSSPSTPPTIDRFSHKFLILLHPEKDQWKQDICSECTKKGFAGMKWKCKECEHYVLCQGCFASVSAQYSHMHKFSSCLPHTEHLIHEKS